MEPGRALHPAPLEPEERHPEPFVRLDQQELESTIADEPRGARLRERISLTYG